MGGFNNRLPRYRVRTSKMGTMVSIIRQDLPGEVVSCRVLVLLFVVLVFVLVVVHDNGKLAVPTDMAGLGQFPNSPPVRRKNFDHGG